MSPSLLDHAFGIRGYGYVQTRYLGGAVIFTIQQPTKALTFPIPRVQCRACGFIRQTRIDFADPRCTYTKAFERFALALSRFMTIPDVVHHLNKNLQKGKWIRRPWPSGRPNPRSGTGFPALLSVA